MSQCELCVITECVNVTVKGLFSQISIVCISFLLAWFFFCGHQKAGRFSGCLYCISLCFIIMYAGYNSFVL